MFSADRYRRWLEQLLHTHDTPQRTAAAFALGIFLGFSPLLGLHAILGLALAFLLRLNRVAVLIGVYANLPWILVPYYTISTIAGAALLGVDVQTSALKNAMDVVAGASIRNLAESTRVLAPLLWAYLVGSTLGAALLAAVSYRVSLGMLLAHRQRQAHKQRERNLDL